jgi:hypothetical protein
MLSTIGDISVNCVSILFCVDVVCLNLVDYSYSCSYGFNFNRDFISNMIDTTFSININ